MTPEQIKEEATRRSLADMPHTCHQLYDCLYYLRDKYGINNDDMEFAKAMCSGRTKALRRSLVKMYEREIRRELGNE